MKCNLVSSWSALTLPRRELQSFPFVMFALAAYKSSRVVCQFRSSLDFKFPFLFPSHSCHRVHVHKRNELRVGSAEDIVEFKICPGSLRWPQPFHGVTDQSL